VILIEMENLHDTKKLVGIEYFIISVFFFICFGNLPKFKYLAG
jgi:hypothetical protein